MTTGCFAKEDGPDFSTLGPPSKPGLLSFKMKGFSQEHQHACLANLTGAMNYDNIPAREEPDDPSDDRRFVKRICRCSF